MAHEKRKEEEQDAQVRKRFVGEMPKSQVAGGSRCLSVVCFYQLAFGQISGSTERLRLHTESGLPKTAPPISSFNKF